MAIISCPNCQGKLKFPDDSPPRRVKCANCSHSFIAGPNGPMPEGKSGAVAKTKAPPTKPAAKTSAPEDAFRFDNDDAAPKKRDDDDDNDRPRVKRRRELDDEVEEEERPRSRRRAEDDDEDDRPRARRRKRNDDDDLEEEDRPRSKRRSRDDDYEMDELPSPKQTKLQFRNARTGINLIGIGFWCQVGALGIAFFVYFLLVVAGENVYELNIPAGLAGLANWILACIGFSFLLAGVKKGNLLGLSIALIAVTAIHLILVIYLTFQTETTLFGKSSGSIRWRVIATQLDTLPTMIVFNFFYDTATLIAAVFELARFILFALVIKEYGRVCKDRDVSKSASMLVILMPAVLGGSLILFLILRLVSKNAGMGSEGKYIGLFMFLLEYGGYIFVYSMAALLCGKTKQAIAFRKK